MYAEVNYIGESTNTIAVARAIKATLTYYSSDGYDKVLLETDLLIMNNIIQKICKIPWEITDLVEEILLIIRDNDIQVTHVFREDNQLADFIANTTIESEDKHVFTAYSQLCSMAKRILNFDKQQIPIV